MRNRTFFFGSYEGLRQRQGIDINSGVLRDDQRAGVTDPVSRNLLAFIPDATATGAGGEGRFVGSATAPVDIDQGTGDMHSHLRAATTRSTATTRSSATSAASRRCRCNTIPGFGDTRAVARGRSAP